MAPDWHLRAQQLRTAGMSYRAVAVELGVTQSAVYKACNPEWARAQGQASEARPERKAAKRQWEREHYRGVCSICGAVTGSRKFSRCRRHKRSYDRAWSRQRRIADLYAQGLSVREIAEDLGTTAGAISGDIHRMRSEGWDLPYRYKMRDGKRVAA